MYEEVVRTNIAYILRLNNALIKQKNRQMASFDLTAIQSDVLMYILGNADKGEINQLDVQAMFRLTNPTVSGIIDRLEEKDFIKRIKSQKDARFRRLVPLPKGQQLMDVLIDSANKAEDELVKNMTEEEKIEFGRLLIIALNTIEDEVR
ncbi:MAG: MarR family transcriptional regulator [Clostridiales bacterium]|nr:MarR family transcriptional regulator [Clostridiales bacterium]